MALPKTEGNEVFGTIRREGWKLGSNLYNPEKRLTAIAKQA
jgi:hypothetical protein